MSSAVVNVKINILVYSSSHFYYQVVYFVHNRGHLLDARCEVPISVATLATAVADANIPVAAQGNDVYSVAQVGYFHTQWNPSVISSLMFYFCVCNLFNIYVLFSSATLL